MHDSEYSLAVKSKTNVVKYIIQQQTIYLYGSRRNVSSTLMLTFLLFIYDPFTYFTP